MYQGLNITSIETSYSNKRITIYTNFDINPASVNSNTILLYSYEDKVELKLRYSVLNKKIDVFIEEDLTPNYLYTLKVSKLENILGDESDSGIRKEILFKSDISEIPVIVEPSDFSEVTNLNIKLNVDIDFSNETEKYLYVQISKNIVFDEVTTIDFKSNSKLINVSKLDVGQYFVRARVETTKIENEIKEGRWSEIVTFNFVEEFGDDSPTVDDDNSYEPIYQENIQLISEPINGETPENIILEFSSKIDPLQIKDIIVIRRDI